MRRVRPRFRDTLGDSRDVCTTAVYESNVCARLLSDGYAWGGALDRWRPFGALSWGVSEALFVVPKTVHEDVPCSV